MGSGSPDAIARYSAALSTFRIGIGALPFLLPLLLQIAFDLNPLQSGLLTFASAAGALTMRLAANPLLVRFGFKRILLGTTFIGAGSIATCAAFTPRTPEAVILLVLLAGGFFRSLQFTSVNVLAYVEAFVKCKTFAEPPHPSSL